MKKVKYFLSFILLTLSLFINANVLDTTSGKKKIDTHKDNWSINTRSLISYPELYQDGDTLFIDTDYTLSNLEVTITDISGNVVQSNTIIVYGGEEYTYIINAAPDTYEVTLRQGSKYLYGYFTIEE